MNVDLAKIKPHELNKLPGDAFRQVLTQLVELQQADRKENQLMYYEPVSKFARKFHNSKSKTKCLGGGNGSSKTETAFVDIIMRATGIIPNSLKDDIDPNDKDIFRGPIAVRVVCESLTTVLHPILLPKLKWWNWTGVDTPGGKRGHWGWIPKTSLIDGSWDRSWSEKTRILRILYTNPATGQIGGESSIQFMSHDQDPSDFASGDFHIVLHDEPPKFSIWRENEARTMRVNGTMMLAMTWPDDPSIPVDWIFDEVYDKAQEGSANYNPDITWINLYTTDNPNLNQEAVGKQAGKWSNETRQVRIFGQPIRFSNRIHPLFTDSTRHWCFNCKKEVIPVDDGSCPDCHNGEVEPFNHVEQTDPNGSWPCIFILDPHPRKPHMFCWLQVDPKDDLCLIQEGELAQEPAMVKKMVYDIESEMGLYVPIRLMDPNMGASPSGTKREISWQQEFMDAGLACDLAIDSDVGRSRINEYLKPDQHTRRPRLIVAERCTKAISQIKRYVWDDFKASLEKDLKQKPKTKYDDWPTMLKYGLNFDPSFSLLKEGAAVIQTRKKGKSNGSSGRVRLRVR